MNERKDGKKPNQALDNDTVAAIKILGKHVPACLLSALFGTAVSTIYMITNGDRRKTIEPMDLESAKRMLTKNFNTLRDADLIG